MSTKTIFVGTKPSVSTGSDVQSYGPHDVASIDQNFANLQASVDAKAPMTALTTGFSIAGGTTSKTLAVTNSITLAGTDGTTITFPGTSTALCPVAGPGSGQAFATGALAVTGNETVSGFLLVGVSSGTRNTIASDDGGVDGAFILNISGLTYGSATFFNGSGSSPNAAVTVMTVAKNSITGRSINAGGTINASGADYAEYELKSATCGNVPKGQIIGFDASGQVTDKWTEAISFGVKSTSPNLVGGDTWGNEDAIGKRPEQPIYQAPVYTGVADPGAEPAEPVLSLPLQPVQQEGETAETFAARTADWQQSCVAAQTVHTAAETAHQAALTVWQTTSAQHTSDQVTYATAVQAAEVVHATAMTQYQTDLATFEAKLEAERQKVDRIAYSGKVPCNSEPGAFVGGYVVAVEGAANSVSGKIITKEQMKADMTQYLDAVGRIRCILTDGRPEIAVIVH
jgi:hypothetical protein